MPAMHFMNKIRRSYFPTLAEQLGYTARDIVVIVNMDDVGFHKNETEASLSALKFGIVKSGSIMVPCPNYEQVIKWWKENPEIDFGIHLTLTCEWGEKYPWTPVLSNDVVPSLYNPDGIMWQSVETLLKNAQPEHIRMELEAQIKKLFDTGLKPSHLDDHMDLHNHIELFPLLMGLSRKYNLPMRVWKRRRYRYPILKYNLPSLRKKGFVFPDSQKGIYYFRGLDTSYDKRKAVYLDYLRSLKPGVHNIKIHVAFKTEELIGVMGDYYSSTRQIDYEVWTSDEINKFTKELGIIFIGFRPLQLLQKKLMKNN